MKHIEHTEWLTFKSTTTSKLGSFPPLNTSLHQDGHAKYTPPLSLFFSICSPAIFIIHLQSPSLSFRVVILSLWRSVPFVSVPTYFTSGSLHYLLPSHSFLLYLVPRICVSLTMLAGLFGCAWALVACIVYFLSYVAGSSHFLSHFSTEHAYKRAVFSFRFCFLPF